MKKPLVLSLICAIAVTALTVSQAENSEVADNREDLDVPARYVPRPDELMTDEEFATATAGETTLALPDDDDVMDFNDTVDEMESGGSKGARSTPKKHARSRWVDSFKYTDTGGLSPANPKCKQFLDETGTYGAYGRIITNYIDEEKKKNGSSILLSDSILGMSNAPKACPKWNTLTEAMKKKFWVWAFAAIASTESGCDAGVKERWGVNDTCSGLLQLEKGYKLRSHRGPNCAEVSPTDIRKPYANLRCGLDIMRSQLVSRNDDDTFTYKGRLYPGPGMTATSYWLKLRKVNGAVIGKLVRSFKPCGA